eukprot:MONOS_2442.1-p1 / transcript=MONOS_2442.1 / gene=MONOS_2442 / organism=Monocercomonoides_exilis_PA203 / gene_product=unspecified product / transcript_product=unspecified product / location=Mono_scaffold00050:131175-132794(-) / protein_length=540 / sequence_SO=supercontig / SO=protein_coding / is_pseudo=false
MDRCSQSSRSASHYFLRTDESYNYIRKERFKENNDVNHSLPFDINKFSCGHTKNLHWKDGTTISAFDNSINCTESENEFGDIDIAKDTMKMSSKMYKSYESPEAILREVIDSLRFKWKTDDSKLSEKRGSWSQLLADGSTTTKRILKKKERNLVDENVLKIVRQQIAEAVEMKLKYGVWVKKDWILSDWEQEMWNKAERSMNADEIRDCYDVEKGCAADLTMEEIKQELHEALELGNEKNRKELNDLFAIKEKEMEDEERIASKSWKGGKDELCGKNHEEHNITNKKENEDVTNEHRKMFIGGIKQNEQLTRNHKISRIKFTLASTCRNGLYQKEPLCTRSEKTVDFSYQQSTDARQIHDRRNYTIVPAYDNKKGSNYFMFSAIPENEMEEASFSIANKGKKLPIFCGKGVVSIDEIRGIDNDSKLELYIIQRQTKSREILPLENEDEEKVLITSFFGCMHYHRPILCDSIHQNDKDCCYSRMKFGNSNLFLNCRKEKSNMMRKKLIDRIRIEKKMIMIRGIDVFIFPSSRPPLLAKPH